MCRQQWAAEICAFIWSPKWHCRLEGRSGPANCHITYSTCCYINHVIKMRRSHALCPLPVSTVTLRCKTSPHASSVDTAVFISWHLQPHAPCGRAAQSMCILMGWQSDFFFFFFLQFECTWAGKFIKSKHQKKTFITLQRLVLSATQQWR